MYRFAYSTNAYTKRPLLEAVEDVKRQGFEGVEILADAPHAFPGRVDAEELARAVRKAGLAISNLNGNTNLGLDRDGRDLEGFWPSFLDPDEKLRRMRIEYVLGVIDLARALGAENVCTSSGRLPEGVPRGRAEKRIADALERILAHADRRPRIKVGIEYEPGFLLGDMRSTLRVLDEFDHPLLGVNLDIGHAVCVREDVAEVVDAFRGRIWNMHLEDIKGRVHDHLIPGEGDIPFEKLRKAIDRTGYDRFLTLELYPYKDDPGEAGRKGLEHLRRIFA